MKAKMVMGVAAVLWLAVAVGVACTGGEEEPTRVPTPVFEPTAAGETAPPAPTPTESAAAEPEPTEVPEPTEAPAGPSGDAARGEELFASNGCNACHSTGSVRLVGPGLQGMLERAATRVDGLSAEAYIEQSIRDPSAFIVDDYSDLMIKTFGDLPDQDIQDLIAYVSSLQ